MNRSPLSLKTPDRLPPERFSASRPPFKYRPEIDGLRAVAVLAVLFCHAEFGVSGGYIGVDVFFVISGYLITALLARDLESDRFSMVDFWERRIRRIFPALSVVIVATLLMGAVVLFSIDFEKLGRSILAVTLLGSNLYFWLSGGYFSGEAKEKPLLHTWSLSVEEQFYIFLPMGLYLLYRFRAQTGRLASPLGFLTIGTGLSLLLAVVGVAMGKWTSSYFLLPTRAWEMLLGSMIALFPTSFFPTKKFIREGASLLGLGMIAAACFLYTPETPFPGLAAIPPCLGAALVIWANMPYGQSAPLKLTLIGRLLASRPFLGVGLISYSLYLWHWPLYAYAKYLAIDTVTVRAGLVALSITLAILSWRYVETPVRKKQLLASRRAVFSFFAVSSLCFLLIGSGLLFTKGVPERFTGNTALNDQLISREQIADDFEDGREPGYFTRVLEIAKRRDFKKMGAEGKPPSFLLWGDSHAGSARPAIDLLLKEAGRGGVAICPAAMAPLVDIGSTLYPRSGEVAEEVLGYLEEHPEIRDILLVAIWSNRYSHDPARFPAALTQTIERLQRGGRRVWIMAQVPISHANIPRMVGRTQLPFLNTPPWKPTLAEHQAKVKEVESAIAQVGMARWITPLPEFIVSGSNTLKMESEGVALYYDTNHLSRDGAITMLLPLFKREILPALKAEPQRD